MILFWQKRCGTEYADSLAQQTLDNSRDDTEYTDSQRQQAWENEQYGNEYADSRSDTEESKAFSLLQMGFSTPQIASILGISEQQAEQYAGMIQSGMQGDVDATNRSNQSSNPTEETFGVIYEEMAKSGDAKAWLRENAAYMTNEELEYARTLLDEGMD